uniref:Uncharacterized protein n=1 Tax=Syphacia muris TaxID=451379 RepID=A0A0N5AQ23_9BILA
MNDDDDDDDDDDDCDDDCNDDDNGSFARVQFFIKEWTWKKRVEDGRVEDKNGRKKPEKEATENIIEAGLISCLFCVLAAEYRVKFKTVY